MSRRGLLGVGSLVSLASMLAAAPSRAAPVCGTLAEFNAAMAGSATSSSDVTLTFDLVGVSPADFHNDKGSLAQMRNTTCNGGEQDSVIKVYGTSEPLNTAHPPGTLKLEYGNACCPSGTCGEKWADPNPSAVIFADGSEQCKVTMWTRPSSIGYKLECGASTFDAVGDNDEGNVVSQIAVLEYLLPGGGKTWSLPNASAQNVQVCYETAVTPAQTITIPVAEDVTVAPSTPTTVFADVGDLAVEAADNQAYLKFVVPAINGTITQALLVMRSRTESFANGDGGEVHPVSSNQWSETTLTYSARPVASPTSLGRIGPVGVDETVSLDITAAIPGPGTYSFAVISPATDGNGTHFFSKEGSSAHPPQLKLTVGPGNGDPDGGWGGSGGLTGTGGSGAAPGSGGGPGVTPNVRNEESESGCGCSLPRRGGGGSLAVVLGLLWALRGRGRARARAT